MNEELVVNFNEDGLLLLNICIAFIMFSVSLNLSLENLRYIVRNPKSVFIGILSQYLMLPLLTIGLIFLIQPSSYIAAGMLLLAACPGGNVSNFFSLKGKGNIELSVTLTTISSLSSAFTTPLMFALLSGVLLQEEMGENIELPFLPTVKVVFLIIVIPAVVGMIVQKLFPRFAEKVNQPLQSISMLVLVGFIVNAFWMNSPILLQAIGTILWIIIIHNALAYLIGRILGRLAKRPAPDQFTIGLETSVQNTALGLVVVFNFFGGNAEMAVVLALWGIWHILSAYVFAMINKQQLKTH